MKLSQHFFKFLAIVLWMVVIYQDVDLSFYPFDFNWVKSVDWVYSANLTRAKLDKELSVARQLPFCESSIGFKCMYDFCVVGETGCKYPQCYYKERIVRNVCPLNLD